MGYQEYSLRGKNKLFLENLSPLNVDTVPSAGSKEAQES